MHNRSVIDFFLSWFASALIPRVDYSSQSYLL